MRSAKKVKKSPGFVTVLVLVVLLAVVGIELIQVYGQLRAAKSQEANISAQVEQRRQENEALQSDLEKADDEEFIKSLARDQLGLAEAGERIFYDVND